MSTTLTAPSRWPTIPEPPDEPRPSKLLIHLESDGVWMWGKRIVAARAGGTRLLLAVLDHLRKEDRKAGRQPLLRNAEAIVKQVPGAKFRYQDVQTWVSRARKALRAAFPEDADLAERVIEGGDGDGYRLGPAVECSGFELTAELAKRQS